ncbi:MAG TPA: cyclic-phosphate processing receiver domain-containing protein, partial [Candidatus Dojkabacteria bacterium]
HDLGCSFENGYDVLLWIENEVVHRNFAPPKISIHSANVSARVKMEQAVEQINKLVGK